MHTKLGLFCDRLIEAGWLAVAIVTPLFFNFYGRRAFEPGKVALLRSIALVMALAWVIKAIEAGLQISDLQAGRLWSGIRHLASQNPLAVPTSFMAAVYILTTATSVVPRISLWGAYARPQGTYATLSYITIFFLIAHSLRTRQQLRRLIAVILLTSLPISLAGIMEHYNLGALPARARLARVQSTLGNPIFLSAYLIMVVPLTLGKLVQLVSTSSDKERGAVSRYALVGLHILLLGLQLTCILFTQSRGPFLGLMGGIFFFSLLLTVYKRRRGLALTMVAVAVVLILFLVVFNLPDTPLTSLRDAPYIGRLGRILGAESFPGRLLIWEGAINMVTASPWRALVGYGPDSMFVAYNKFYPLELTRYELGKRPDHCHNQTFDALVTGGLLGFIAYVLLFSSVFYYGLKGLGLIGGRRQRAIFIFLWAIGGALGTLIPRLLEGTWRLAGAGLPLGLVTALAIYLVVHVLFFNAAGRKVETGWRQTLLIALLSSLVAHFIEVQSGIAVAATPSYFWLCAALLVVVGYSLQEGSLSRAKAQVPPVVASDRRHGKRRRKRERTTGRPTRRIMLSPWRDMTISCSLSVGLILMTMGFDFITYLFDPKTDGLRVLGFIAVVWLLCGAFAVAEMGSQEEAFLQRSRGRAFSFLIYSLISLGWFVAFVFVHVGMMRPGADLANVIVFYFLFLFSNMAAIAISLMGGARLPSLPWRRATRWLYPLLGLGLAVLIFTTNLSVIKADIYHKVGLAFQKLGRYDDSIAFYRRALSLAPDQDHYYLFIGLDSMAKMGEASDPQQRSHWFHEAQKALERAREINPLDPDYPANVGTLYLRWAGMTADPAERAQRLEKALTYYRQTTAMSPHHHGLRLESDLFQIHILLGTTYQQLGRIDEAITEAKMARELAPAEETEKLEALIAELEAQKP